MKKRKLYTVALLFIFIAAFAQKEENNALNREMIIEKDFTPIVQDASKINILPRVETPSIRKTSILYSDWTVPVTTPSVLQILPAAVYDTGSPFYRKRGYADLSLGNYLNASASVGYRILDNEKNRLNFWYQHLSTHGKVKYLGTDDKVKQKRNDNLLHVGYKHRFNNLIWTLNGDYRFNAFNYYGREYFPFLGDVVAAPIVNNNKMQQIQQFSISTGFGSPREQDRELYYLLSVGYHRYSNRLGLYYGEKGNNENHIDTRFKLLAPVTANQRIGIDGSMDNLIFDNRNSTDYKNLDLDNFTMITLNPYYSLDKDRLKFRLGAVANVSFNDGTIVRFAPDIRFDWEFIEHFFLYSSILGGKELNTFASLSKDNIYVDPSTLPYNSYTPADWIIGLKSNVLNCFTFDLFGGVKYTQDALFDYRYLGMKFDVESRDIIKTVDWMTRPVVNYANLDAFAWNVGARVKYKFDDILNVSLEWKHEIRKADIYGGEKNILKTNRPTDALNALVEVKILPQLTLHADYFMGLGRGTILSFNTFAGTSLELLPYVPTVNEAVTLRGKLRDIHDLGVGAVYQINDAVHLRVRFDNILNRRYDIYYAMPAQGFHFMAGVGVNF